MQAPERNKPGRRAYVPSSAERDTVRRMAGASHASIASVIGVSVPTLRKAFRAELDEAKAADLFTAEAAPRAPRQRAAAGGRKPFRPEEHHRRRVRELAAVGRPPSAIARVLNISEPTLRKHFAEELATGAERVEAEIVAALMSKARSGNVTAQREVLSRIAQARLDNMEDALRAAPVAKPDVARPETPGKKMQASLQAADIIQTAPWAEHLRTH